MRVDLKATEQVHGLVAVPLGHCGKLAVAEQRTRALAGFVCYSACQTEFLEPLQHTADYLTPPLTFAAGRLCEGFRVKTSLDTSLTQVAVDDISATDAVCISSRCSERKPDIISVQSPLDSVSLLSIPFATSKAASQLV